MICMSMPLHIPVGPRVASGAHTAVGKVAVVAFREHLVTNAIAHRERSLGPTQTIQTHQSVHYLSHFACVVWCAQGTQQAGPVVAKDPGVSLTPLRETPLAFGLAAWIVYGVLHTTIIVLH